MLTSLYLKIAAALVVVVLACSSLYLFRAVGVERARTAQVQSELDQARVAYQAAIKTSQRAAVALAAARKQAAQLKDSRDAELQAALAGPAAVWAADAVPAAVADSLRK